MHRWIWIWCALSVQGLMSQAASAESIPTPEAFLGYELGSRFTEHARVVSYAKEIVAKSPRARLYEYGRSYEGRPLLYVILSAAERMATLEEARLRLAHLADPRGFARDFDREGAISASPVMIWLSYNVHGNEPSGTEAALRVLHRLASANDPETLRWLDQAIIAIDPCLNPDGRDRYASWFNATTGRRPDPELQSMEHREPWPGGRTNHYGFDLNRDWAFSTQVETVARLPELLRWNPQVHVDFHEMGYDSTYFFFPAEKPINAHLPESTLEWGRRFGAGNAKAFDERGWPYYTEEDFDLFYPGYGDSWPSFTGAIGMTYEQAGLGRAGASVRRPDGSLLTLKDRVAHQVVATESTIGTAVAGKNDLLRDYVKFRESAIHEGSTGPIRSFLLPEGGDLGALDALVACLRRQGIEVRETTDSFVLAKTRSTQGEEVFDRSFAAGTRVVELAQPLKRLALTLLEPRTKIRELFFYDVSAWSLPLVFGVTVYECTQALPVATKLLVESLPRPGGVKGEATTVGWLLPYGTRGAMEALVDLLSAGVKVRSARREFSALERNFDRGSLLIRRSDQLREVAADIEAVGRRRSVEFHAVSDGYTERGIDLGSTSFVLVAPPRVALLGGEGVDVTSFGSTRWLLDQVLDLPHSVLPIGKLADLDLHGFSSVVIPECRVPKEGASTLVEFAREGGVVIAMGDSAFSLLRLEPPIVAITDRESSEKKADPEPAPTPPKRWIHEREEEDRRRQQPGSIFTVELDPSHPIGFGYRSEVAAFKVGTRSFDAKGPGLHVGVFKDASPLSGYVNSEDDLKLRGRSFVSVEEVGSGFFVLFADDVNFRGAWRGLSRLFVNAALLMPTRFPTSVR